MSKAGIAVGERGCHEKRYESDDPAATVDGDDDTFVADEVKITLLSEDTTAADVKIQIVLAADAAGRSTAVWQAPCRSCSCWEEFSARTWCCK